MLLAEVKQHLQYSHSQSLLELSQRFQITADVMRDMLAILVRKGQVKQCTKTPRCGVKCNQCSIVTTEIYEWIPRR